MSANGNLSNLKNVWSLINFLCQWFTPLEWNQWTDLFCWTFPIYCTAFSPFVVVGTLLFGCSIDNQFTSHSNEHPPEKTETISYSNWISIATFRSVCYLVHNRSGLQSSIGFLNPFTEFLTLRSVYRFGSFSEPTECAHLHMHDGIQCKRFATKQFELCLATGCEKSLQSGCKFN